MSTNEQLEESYSIEAQIIPVEEIIHSKDRGLGKVRQEEGRKNQAIMDKATQRTFLYRGMIRCNSCNSAYSPELKSKQNFNHKR